MLKDGSEPTKASSPGNSHNQKATEIKLDELRRRGSMSFYVNLKHAPQKKKKKKREREREKGGVGWGERGIKESKECQYCHKNGLKRALSTRQPPQT